MVVDVVVEVATVAADVVTGTDGPDAVTVATDVVTAVVLGTVTGTVAVGDVTVAVGDVTVAVGDVTVAIGDVTVAIGDVTVAVGDVTVAVGTVTVWVVIGVDSVTVGSPIAPGWLPASTLAPKKPATATQTSAMTARRVTKRSAPHPPLVVPPQWARFLSPSTYILARSGYCRNPLPNNVQGKSLGSGLLYWSERSEQAPDSTTPIRT
jgi:hypothetical protein